jgi:hypothetical protein
MILSGEIVNGLVKTAALLRGIPFLAGGRQNVIEYTWQHVLGNCNLATMVIGVPPCISMWFGQSIQLKRLLFFLSCVRNYYDLIRQEIEMLQWLRRLAAVF